MELLERRRKILRKGRNSGVLGRVAVLAKVRAVVVQREV
jgi:hypothetical protein